MGTRVIALILFLSLGLVGVSLYLISSIDPGKKPKPTAEVINVTDVNLKIQSAFSLKTSEGVDFNQDSLKGKFSLLYFGFTNCPDFCDESMAKMASVMSIFKEKDLQSLQFIFVSVDPGRDTHEVIKKYLDQYNNKIIAVTGEATEVEKLTNDLKAYFAVVPNSSEDNYYVDHSSFIYLIDKKGQLVSQFTPNATPEIIAAQIKYKMK